MLKSFQLQRGFAPDPRQALIGPTIGLRKFDLGLFRPIPARHKCAQ